MRQLYIETNRDGIISNISNIAGSAYQYRIRPTSMAAGGGSYIGFAIPKSLREISVGVFTAEASADTVILIGESKDGLGAV